MLVVVSFFPKQISIFLLSYLPFFCRLPLLFFNIFFFLNWNPYFIIRGSTLQNYLSTFAEAEEGKGGKKTNNNNGNTKTTSVSFKPQYVEKLSEMEELVVMTARKLLMAKAGGDGEVVGRAVQEMGMENVSIKKNFFNHHSSPEKELFPPT